MLNGRLPVSHAVTCTMTTWTLEEWTVECRNAASSGMRVVNPARLATLGAALRRASSQQASSPGRPALCTSESSQPDFCELCHSCRFAWSFEGGSGTSELTRSWWLRTWSKLARNLCGCLSESCALRPYVGGVVIVVPRQLS